tara:strand:+ start:76 stop:723 length:648 start_codon:yes stop_codon:yes gene_type:complete
MRLQIKGPKPFPYNLNSRIDTLLKNEFDVARKNKEQTVYQKEANINAIPFSHPELDVWREPFKAARFHHKDTNIVIAGSVDDLWENLDTKKIHIVDYKSTHTDKFDMLKSFNAPYLIGYKRQAEIYSWILSKLGLEIDKTSYFFYVNAKPEQEIFDNSLEFEWAIIPYTTKDYNWVENIIVEIKNFLETNKIPSSSQDCDLCKYMSKFFDFIKKK